MFFCGSFFCVWHWWTIYEYITGITLSSLLFLRSFFNCFLFYMFFQFRYWFYLLMLSLSCCNVFLVCFVCLLCTIYIHFTMVRYHPLAPLRPFTFSRVPHVPHEHYRKSHIYIFLSVYIYVCVWLCIWFVHLISPVFTCCYTLHLLESKKKCLNEGAYISGKTYHKKYRLHYSVCVCVCLARNYHYALP